MIPTGPEDVINEIDKWRKSHSDSKVAAGVRFGLGQLQRFNASIDMLAQGTPSPGCLLWSSIKFVLTVSCVRICVHVIPCRLLLNLTTYEPMNSTPSIPLGFLVVVVDNYAS